MVGSTGHTFLSEELIMKEKVTRKRRLRISKNSQSKRGVEMKRNEEGKAGSEIIQAITEHPHCELPRHFFERALTSKSDEVMASD